MGAFLTGAGADLQNHSILPGPVHQMVTIGVAGLEGRRLACPEQRFAGIFNQDQLARNDEDQFVLGLVPVALRGRGTRRQARQVDPELGEPGRIPQRLAGARIGHRLERRRID